MKLQIIETPDYILAVSDEEIKEGGKYLLIPENQIKTADRDLPINSREWVQVIAYQPKGNAPELDLPLLPEIVVEDDVEKLAEEYAKMYYSENIKAKLGYIAGYKTATKVYSEEDLRKAIDIVRKDTYKRESVDEIIQSLNQPKAPKWFVTEIEDYCGSPLTTEKCPKCIDSCDRAYERPKTTTIDGKEYLVGTYLYE